MVPKVDASRTSDKMTRNRRSYPANDGQQTGTDHEGAAEQFTGPWPIACDHGRQRVGLTPFDEQKGERAEGGRDIQLTEIHGPQRARGDGIDEHGQWRGYDLRAHQKQGIAQDQPLRRAAHRSALSSAVSRDRLSMAARIATLGSSMMV